MRWQRDGFSVQAALKKKRRLDPDHWYYDRPEDFPGLDFFYVAFRDLQTERRDAGPIPWSACMAYACHKGLAPDVADTLWAVVRRMDDTEREWQLEQLKSESGRA